MNPAPPPPVHPRNALADLSISPRNTPPNLPFKQRNTPTDLSISLRDTPPALSIEKRDMAEPTPAPGPTSEPPNNSAFTTGSGPASEATSEAASTPRSGPPSHPAPTTGSGPASYPSPATEPGPTSHPTSERADHSAEPLVVVERIRKVYRTGPKEVIALRDVSFEAYPGELIAIRGRSGSGKTTLLNQVGGLDRPDSGRVIVAGRPVTELSEAGLLELRRDVIGFVFQSFGLIPVLSAAENVGVPMRLSRMPAPEREERIRMLLSMVGLDKHMNQRPYELSGGQQQRVAVARALANRPRLLIADEPTGQLDSQTGRQIMQLLRAVVRSEGVTALVATHDPSLITLADRLLELHDGGFVPAGPPAPQAATTA